MKVSSPAAPATSARTSRARWPRPGTRRSSSTICAARRASGSATSPTRRWRARTRRRWPTSSRRHRPDRASSISPATSASASRCAIPTSTGATTSAPRASLLVACARHPGRGGALLVHRRGVRQRRGVADPGARAARADLALRRVEARRSSACCTPARRRSAFARRRCATSTPPAPTPPGASARRTTPRSISSRASSTRCSPARPVQVYGNDYPTRDGTCVRDYIHVTDLASAHVQRDRGRARCRAASASTSAPASGNSVLQVIEAVGRAARASRRTIDDPAAPPRRSRQPGRRPVRAARRARLATPSTRASRRSSTRPSVGAVAPRSRDEVAAGVPVRT